MIAQILSTWSGAGTSENPYHPTLLDDYPGIEKFFDVTSQPAENLIPSVNLFVVQIECPASVLEAIELDNNYVVLWSEEI